MEAKLPAQEPKRSTGAVRSGGGKLQPGSEARAEEIPIGVALAGLPLFAGECVDELLDGDRPAV